MPNLNDGSSTLSKGKNEQRQNECFCNLKTFLCFIFCSTVSIVLIAAFLYLFGPWIIAFEEIEEHSMQINSEAYDNLTQSIRLPKDIKPIHYRLRLKPNLDNFTFQGRVSISIKCIEKTDTVILHSELLNLTKVQLLATEEKDFASNKYHFAEVMMVGLQRVVYVGSKLVIKLNSELELGHKYLLDVEFSGEIGNGLVGFYRSSYLNDSGVRRWMATTHFQPNYARYMFPCFDEPGFKSHFEISVARRTNMTVLSNMHLKETEPIKNVSGWVWDHFAVSKLMSTYLVAITISDMESINVKLNKPGPVVKIWAPKNLLPRAEYASQIIDEIFTFFENYFQTKYALLKLDLVVVPDFAMGAMENWGHISFRESSILLDDSTKCVLTERHIFNVIAHEIAHQWFGNLVTLEWWSELWLNEGFATYFAHLAEEKLRPKWGSNFYEIVNKALLIDSQTSSHPLNMPITSETDIVPIFDPIMYDKAACILRMIANAIEEKNFRSGIRNYIEKHAFKTATEESLMASLEKYTNFPVYFTIASFSSKSGYPLIEVSRNFNSSSLTIRQSKFGSNDNSSWLVPVTYKTKSMSKVQHLLLTEKMTKVKVLTPSSDWVLFNLERTGFYRVNYELENWHKLISQFSRLPMPNRCQLLDDGFEMAKIGLVPYHIVFKMMKNLYISEDSFNPWSVAIKKMEFFENVYMDTDAFGIYKNYMLIVLLSKIKTIETFDVDALTALLLEKLCALKYTNCSTLAGKTFNKVQVGLQEERYPYNLQYSIYCMAVSHGTDEIWDDLWNMTLSPELSGMELRNIYLALGCSSETWKINSYLEKTLTGEIKPQHFIYVWRSISNQPIGRLVGLNFLETNWEKFFTVYGNDFGMLQGVVDEFLMKLSTKIDLNKIRSFYEKHAERLILVSKPFQSVIETIEMKVNWIQKYGADVLSILKNPSFI